MTVQTTAGTTFSVSAADPATYDAPGYIALSWTEVGEVTNLDEFGREYNLVTHNPIGSRGTQKFKGAFNEGSVALELGLDTDDAGQILLKAASQSDSDYSFRIVEQNTDTYYFQGKVMTWKVRNGEVDSITSARAVIEITTNSSGVGVVDDLAT